MKASEYNNLVSSETQEQITLADRLNLIKYNGRPLQWFHCPNEGKRSGKMAAILKRMGLKPGVPDIIILDTPPAFPIQKGAVIEMKRREDGKTSPEQEEWLEYFDNNSWVTGVANGIDEALELLKKWGYT